MVLRASFSTLWHKTRSLPRLRWIALRPQDRLLHVRALHKPRTQFIEASSPTHSSSVAPFGFVGPCSSTPPPPLPPPPLPLTRRFSRSPAQLPSNRKFPRPA